MLLWRLSVLMFLLYAPSGALLPLLSLQLERLHFTPVEIGWIYATQAIGALLAPLVAGQVADRWFPAQYCLSVCAAIAAVLLWVQSEITAPLTFFLVSLFCWFMMVPAITLGTSLCFTHLPKPQQQFGGVRLWGTIGWVLPCWLLSFWFENHGLLAWFATWLRPDNPRSDLPDAFRLSAMLAAGLSIYALTLPHTPPSRTIGRWLAPLGAMHLLKRRAFAVYIGVMLGLYVTVAFTGQMTQLLLKELGISLPWVCRTLTLAQFTEVLALAILPWLLFRLGRAGTMRLGIVAWTLGLTVMTIGQPTELVVASLGLNGLLICCFLVAGQVFLNSQATGDIRASTQGLFTFTSGLGLLIGNLLVGEVRSYFNRAFAPSFGVAAGIGVVLVVLFFLGFPDDEKPDAEIQATKSQESETVIEPGAG